jgi:hypothetical protein
MNTAVCLAVDVCHSVWIFRWMLTLCRWVVFAYTLFTVERFRDVIGLDLNIYKYFMFSDQLRNTSCTSHIFGTQTYAIDISVRYCLVMKNLGPLRRK